MAQPPPAAKVSSRVRKGFQAIAANAQKMEAIRHNAEISRYFDGSAPGTRSKREQARAQFEEFVECCYGLQDVNEIWSKDTFISYTKQFLEGITHVSVGKFEEKIKTPTLWSYKHAIYWWAAVLVKDFNLLWQSWHEEVSRHIHMLAVQKSLSTRYWKKNNLSDSELVLIFRYIREQRYGIANLKQHWAAMLLVWLTSARPGSFTVSPGYQQGASTGLKGKVRETSDTLRWSDVEFVNMKGGIAVRITFRFNKGYRDPNKDGQHVADARRTFTFLPTMAERLEFDMPLILFGIAHERGLFVQPLEEILDQTASEVFIQKEPEIDQQAIFVAATQAGHLDPTKPMNENALNPKLQQLCTAIGLLERNTYYSIRRTAIIEVRRDHSTEQAKDLAFHKPSANSLFFYDNVGFGDVDMQQFRLGGSEGMSREEVRKYFSQASLSQFLPEQDTGNTLQQALDHNVKVQLPQQPDYIAHEVELRNLYEEIGKKLDDLQTSGVIPETEKVPSGFSAWAGARYRSLSSKYGLEEYAKKIDSHLADRKKLHRAIRLRLRKEIKEGMRKEHKAITTESTAQSARRLSGGGTYEPKPVRGVKVAGLGQTAEEGSFFGEEGEDNALSDDEDNEGVDEDAFEDDGVDPRAEPECWSGLEDEVHVQIGKGTATVETEQIRREFLMAWIKQSDSVVPKSDLVCPRCQIDPTMDEKAKERKFNLFRLNTHMRGSTHTREAQLRRALKIDGKDNTTIIICPTCKAMEKGVRNFIKHVKSVHEILLWEDIEDEGSSQQVTDGSEFEGFSDALEEEATDFAGFSSPPPAVTGDGKEKVL